MLADKVCLQVFVYELNVKLTLLNCLNNNPISFCNIPTYIFNYCISVTFSTLRLDDI